MEVNGTLLSVWMNPKNFPSKLWHLVNDPQICSICWDDSGEGILICQEAFKAEVLSRANRQMNKYFTTTDFTSFLRQLNLYGFRKVCSDQDNSKKQVHETMHHFHNPNFKRANPELLVNLKRLTPANKAKLAAGKEMPNQSSRHFPYMMKNSPEKYSAVAGEDLAIHQQTPHHQYSQQVKGGNTTPQTSQALVPSHGDSSSEFLMDFPSAHPSSPMQQGSPCAVPDGNLGAVMPHYSECCFYAPVYQCCMPGSMDSVMPCCQPVPASCARCGCYPTCSPSHLHFPGQDPNWQAGVAPDPSKSYMNLGAVFSVEDEVQVSSDIHLHSSGQDPNWQSAGPSYPSMSQMNLDIVPHVEDVLQVSSDSHLYSIGQDPNWLLSDAPDPRMNQMDLEIVSRVEEELQAAASITLPTDQQ